MLFIGLTWLIPAGEYAHQTLDGKTIVVAGTYQHVEAEPQGIGALLTAPIKGIIGAANIIAFVLLVGGAFSVLTATGAMDAGLGSVLKYAKKNPGMRHLIIPLLMVLFSLGGCTFGMSEENLVFILITIPLARSMGYDNIVGIAIPFVGAGAGFAGAVINPFTIGIAQGISELPVGSGAGYRWIVWAIFTIIAIAFVMAYVFKLEKNPHMGLQTEPDSESDAGAMKEVSFTGSRKIVLILICVKKK